MNVEWIMFANYADEQGGLLYMSGASWDTINVGGPPIIAPPGVDVVAAINGYLVIRLLFHVTEAGRTHSFNLVLMDEDGQELHKLMGEFDVQRNPELPTGWDQGFNFIIGLTGMPLPRFGSYEFHLLVDDQHVGSRPFRVIKRYEDQGPALT